MELFSEISVYLLLGLFFLGTATFTLSTISGGGGAMMQIPILNFLKSPPSTSPNSQNGSQRTERARKVRPSLHFSWSNFAPLERQPVERRTSSLWKGLAFGKANSDFCLRKGLACGKAKFRTC